MGTRALKVWAPDGLPLQHLNNLAPLEVEHRSVRWDWKTFHTELLSRLANGSAPDVIEIGSTWTTRLAREGVLLNITEFAEHLNAASIFFPRTLYSCRDAAQIDQYYALPWLADVRILFYNEDYLNLKDHPNGFKNWKAFQDMCEALNKKKRPDHIIAWPTDASAFHDVLPWVWAAGGDFISPSHQVLIDSERTQEAICRLARFILTGCAPIPHNELTETPDKLRTQFTAGNVAIMAGALWLTHTPGWHSKFKAALHPPDLFPATFIGVSNLAIVRKHGADENAEAYQSAKEFIKLMVDNVENQIISAKKIGKLPCNIPAWKQMKEQDENTRAVLETFDKALCYTEDRRMPNLLNFEQIEEELKTCIRTIWEEVGKIQGASIEDEKEKKCKEMIRQKLTDARKNIEKFLTGYTVQYTKQEVEEIGITPPGTFDLWLEVTSNTPTVKGTVYVAGIGQIQKGIGPKPFRILLALVNAPERTLSQERLLEDFFKYSPSSDHERMDEIYRLEKELSKLAALLKKSLEGTINQQLLNELQQLLNELQQHGAVLPDSPLASQLKRIRDFQINRFQKLVCDLITLLCEGIEYIANNSERSKKIDDLRKTYENLNKKLGQIRNKPVVNRSPHNYDFYLDNDLSICVVVP